jgi:hypothetical protein
MLTSSIIELSEEDRAALARAIDRDFRQLSVRLPRAEISAIAQPWFAEHRILHVESATVEPAIGAHVARLPDGEFDVLTGRIAALHELVQRESANITDAEEAALYAHNADLWTTEYELSDMTLDSFDEMPWRKLLDEAQKARIEALTATYPAEITPPATLEYGDGWRVTKWVLCNRQIIFRVLDVTRRGELSRNDIVREKELPVHPGNWWKKVNGKMVPIG